MRTRNKIGRTCTALVVLILLALPVCAQEESALQQGTVNTGVLNSKIAEVEASTTLSEETAGTLVDLYRRALTNLERTRAERTSAMGYAAAAASAPGELLILRETLESRQTVDDKGPGIKPGASLPELQQLFAEAKARFAEAEDRLARFRTRYASEVGRPAVARERLSEARKELSSALAELNAPSLVDEAPDLTEAHRWNLQARAGRLDAEINKLDQELRTHAVRLELLVAQQDTATTEVESARSHARMLEDAISAEQDVKAEQARQQAEVTRQEFEGRHPLVRDFALENVDLGDRLAARIADVQAAFDRRDAARLLVTRIENELSSTQHRLAIAGLDQVLGQVLIEHHRALPDLLELRKLGRAREQQITVVALEQIELTEQRRELRDINVFIKELTTNFPAIEADQLRPELQTLAGNRRDLVQQLIDAGASYVRVMSELNDTQDKLLGVVRDYDEFLGKTLLWVRNSAPFRVNVLGSLPGDIRRLLSPHNWAGAMRDGATALRGSPPITALLVALLALGLLRPRFLARVDATAKRVDRIITDRFMYSVEALIFTAMAAMPMPLFIILTGAAINSNLEATTFSSAVAASLVKVGVDLMIIQFFFDACRSDGLALNHCRWPVFSVGKLRGELRWFRVAFPALRFAGETGFLLDAGGLIGGLSVTGGVASAATMAVFIIRLLTPDGGVLSDFLGHRENKLLARTRRAWLGALMLVLPLLIVLWLAGFNYSGDLLAVSFMYSFWLVLGLMILQGLLYRWHLRGSQRLQFRAAQERREAQNAARAKEQGRSHTLIEDADLEVDEPEIDFKAIDDNSRRLLRVMLVFAATFGLWLIWSPILPALGIFEEVALWTRDGIVSGESVQIPVTLVDLFFAVITVIVTVVAARGLPSLVEFILLQHTTVVTGTRYAATTLLRYAILGIGAVLALSMLGGDWSKIQWLVAAMGVGIGFGLQEIVANFISGLIILFERPVRIGDVVTVGNINGVVTRIRIRATTIRDWERRELLVPNREFITKPVLNWSLTDSVIRLTINVGIEYGSDVMRAMKLLEEAASENENVLKDPVPFVVFEGFGDSALKLSLRVYVPSIENRLSIQTELHASLNRKLGEAGIVIAFPQRDIHLDTSKPLDIRMHAVATTAPDPTK